MKLARHHSVSLEDESQDRQQSAEKKSYRKLLQPIVSAGEQTSRRTLAGLPVLAYLEDRVEERKRPARVTALRGIDERSVAMCDYSLERIASRAAVTGDRLVTAD